METDIKLFTGNEKATCCEDNEAVSKTIQCRKSAKRIPLESVGV